MRRIIYIIAILVLTTSCGSQKPNYRVMSMKGEYIPVTKTKYPNWDLENFVASYKTQLDAEMNKVIGYSAQDMSTGRPESLLTNLTSDLMRELSTEYTEGRPIDIAFMNVHGIRAPIAKGKITVGNIFDAYPFDNELAVVRLKGNYLTEIFESYAHMGGAGVSSNVRLTIKENKLIEVLVEGKPVDKDKVYTIVTLDYLAEGNDGMNAIRNAESSVNTQIKLREYMLQNIQRIEEDKKEITSTLDGRITIIE